MDQNQMAVDGPKSLIPDPEQQSHHRVPSPTSVGLTHVDASVGAEMSVNVESPVTPTIVASNIGTPRGSPDSFPELEALRGFRRRWMERKDSDGSASDPIDDFSLVQDHDPIEPCTPSFVNPVEEDEASPTGSSGVVSKSSDAYRMAEFDFLTNAKLSNIKMPWEEPSVKAIFDDDLFLKPELKHDMSVRPATDVSAPEVKAQAASSLGHHSSLQPVFERCVQSIKEQTFIQTRERDMEAAVIKWSIVIRANSSASAVGKQIEHNPGDDIRIIRATMGVKSPNTVLSRANAMLAYMRWHTIERPTEDFIPMQEQHAWEYVSFLAMSGAPASRAQSFVQSCRFAHHILGIEGASSIIDSRRIIGTSEIQLSLKETAKQARPLTVYELQRLHQMAADPGRHIKDRVLVSHLLLMTYCRCRHSDTLQVEDVQHDHSRNLGYLQLRTRFHKGSKSAGKKSLLLPIVASSSGVGFPPWIEIWWQNRMEAGLPVQGDLKGPIMPAPLAKGEGWTCRPLTSAEVSKILREFLELPHDVLLSSHSMKATLLSWCAKANVPKEQRRLLGRHSSAVVDADSIYSRDIMYTPLDAMDKVLAAICEGRFMPDAPRSQYWPLAEPISRTPVPQTPHGPSVLPMTPPIHPKHMTLRDFEESTVKQEVHRDSDGRSEVAGDVVEVVDISSESDLDSSSSEPPDSSDIEPEDFHVEESPVKRRAVGPLVPSDNEQWFQHQVTRTVHALEVCKVASQVAMCGRRLTSTYRRIQQIDDWTLKCRVCFVNRRSSVGLA